MRRWMQRIGLWACCLALVAVVWGCHRDKRKEVRIEHEQRAGEVEEVRPGEMVVE